MYEGVFELPTRLWDVNVGCGARWVAGSSPPWAIVLAHDAGQRESCTAEHVDKTDGAQGTGRDGHATTSRDRGIT